ncbi:hypothetical protein SEPCBS57363_002787 [Sporothrix epigloea]|uniref:MULE transposase domain-containing protein n=1 Tax=Sporothrix epigloea TaxID=1892477 RepID=A0ABP0DM09_9PEZI
MVVITDYEKSLEAALKIVWPATQQQVCILHVNMNIFLNVREKWRKPYVVEEDPDIEDDEDVSESVWEEVNAQ